jgi:hypothetical protein
VSYISNLLLTVADVAANWDSHPPADVVNKLRADLEAAQGDDRHLQYLIEDQWLARAKTMQYGKSSTITYKRKEIEFFMGASAALNAVFPNPEQDRLSPLVPVSWMLKIMMGENVVGSERIE